MSDSEVAQRTGSPAVGDAGEDESRMPLGFLQYQRDSVLSIIEGLPEADWHRPVVPAGWTVAGMVEHLGGAEYHWFQQVVTGVQEELPEDEDLPSYDPEAAFVSDSPSADIVASYRDECRRSDEILAVTPLSAAD